MLGALADGGDLVSKEPVRLAVEFLGGFPLLAAGFDDRESAVLTEDGSAALAVNGRIEWPG